MELVGSSGQRILFTEFIYAFFDRLMMIFVTCWCLCVRLIYGVGIYRVCNKIGVDYFFEYNLFISRLLQYNYRNIRNIDVI